MVQEILVKSDGQRCFVPPYMGPKGWVGVRLDYKVNWDEVAAILKDGYLMSAPKRLGSQSASLTLTGAGADPFLTDRSRSGFRARFAPGVDHERPHVTPKPYPHGEDRHPNAGETPLALSVKRRQNEAFT